MREKIYHSGFACCMNTLRDNGYHSSADRRAYRRIKETGSHGRKSRFHSKSTLSEVFPSETFPRLPGSSREHNETAARDGAVARSFVRSSFGRGKAKIRGSDGVAGQSIIFFCLPVSVDSGRGGDATRPTLTRVLCAARRSAFTIRHPPRSRTSVEKKNGFELAVARPCRATDRVLCRGVVVTDGGVCVEEMRFVSLLSRSPNY